MKIGVIDAQGAGLAQAFIKMARKALKEIYIVALGTNPTATLNMIKAGANEGITGEADICAYLRSGEVDCIVGPIGVLCSGGIEGEITNKISSAVLQKDCIKYIIPLFKHGIYIPGTRNLQIKDIMSEIIRDVSKNGKK